MTSYNEFYAHLENNEVKALYYEPESRVLEIRGKLKKELEKTTLICDVRAKQ